jgi:NAD(P)-dependent dehydrogenase (short-subunit alcohol dehydrogenase family)
VSDRVVIVTGASRRIAIGAAIARRLVADGYAGWTAPADTAAWSPGC